MQVVQQIDDRKRSALDDKSLFLAQPSDLIMAASALARDGDHSVAGFAFDAVRAVEVEKLKYFPRLGFGLPRKRFAGSKNMLGMGLERVCAFYVRVEHMPMIQHKGAGRVDQDPRQQKEPGVEVNLTNDLVKFRGFPGFGGRRDSCFFQCIIPLPRSFSLFGSGRSGIIRCWSIFSALRVFAARRRWRWLLWPARCRRRWCRRCRPHRARRRR